MVPQYSTRIFYSAGWTDKDIHELSNYSQNVQLSKRKKAMNSDAELQRLNNLAISMERDLMKKVDMYAVIVSVETILYSTKARPYKLNIYKLIGSRLNSLILYNKGLGIFSFLLKCIKYVI